MGDHYLMLLEQLESEANAYDYTPEPDEADMNDWFSGTSPWEEPEGYEAPF